MGHTLPMLLGQNWPMTARGQTGQYDEHIRSVVRDNVRKLREHHAPGVATRPWQETQPVSRGTLRHWDDLSAGATVDNLAVLARNYDLEAWQLLVPTFDPANPPTLAQSDTATPAGPDVAPSRRRTTTTS
jgi:hypothetical protein